MATSLIFDFWNLTILRRRNGEHIFAIEYHVLWIVPTHVDMHRGARWKKAHKALEFFNISFCFQCGLDFEPETKITTKVASTNSLQLSELSPSLSTSRRERWERKRQLSMPPEMFRCATYSRIAVCQLFHTRWLLQLGYQTVDLWTEVERTGVALLLCRACWMGCSVIGLDDYIAKRFWANFLNYAWQIIQQKLFVILCLRSFVRYYDTSQAIRHTPKWSAALWATDIVHCFVLTVNVAIQRTLSWVPVPAP